MDNQRIGFIGLGAMGEPMVANLLNAGFQVCSYVNRSREAMDRLKQSGLEEVANAQEVAKRSDIIMCCVFDERQNDAVLRGNNGVIGSLASGSTVLLMSTISPGYCQALASEAAKRGIIVLDCPLSGMVQGAIDGTLSLMMGGSVKDIDRCRATLAPLGTIMHCGDIGAGQVMKLANNAIAITTYSLVLEIRDMASTYGMDINTFMDILNKSTGRSFVSSHFPMRKGRLRMAGMPKKDVGTCLELADELGVTLPVVQQCYEAGIAESAKKN